MKPVTITLNPRVLALVVLALVAGAAGLAFTLGSDGAPEAHDAHAAAPADTAGKSGLAAYDADGDGIVYRSGMHPWIVQDEPGQCPICGMDLAPTPVTASEEGVVRVDPGTIQNIGVRTARVEVAALARSVRTTGRFEASEQGLAAVSPKVGGWVEQLFVDYEGARVRRGQPLLSIYSPELVATQEEYLLALRHAERLGGSADGQRLVDAARRRLAYWDVTDEQIEQLRQSGQPQKTVTLYAPASGTVVRKAVVEGQQIAPGMTLMELSDLSRLWLMVDVYEQDLAWVRPGTAAQVALPYDPGTVLSGTVDYVYDTLDPATRTAKARVTLPNPGLRLKPGMYATVTLTGGPSEPAPVVPEEALLRTGDRAVVVLALGEGRFHPVEVVPGAQAGGRTQVLSGLVGGEEVVTSAQFLIDSEARLKSAVGAMVSGHQHEHDAGMGGRGDAGTVDGPVGAAVGPAGGPAAGSGDAAGVRVVEVAVSAAGYAPSAITLEAGVPARLVFTRTAEGACIEQVQVPAFGIGATALPMHTPVAFDVTPAEGGTFTFACGMDMVKGTIMVRHHRS